MPAAVAKRNILVLDRWRGEAPQQIRRRLRFFSNTGYVGGLYGVSNQLRLPSWGLSIFLLEIVRNFSERTSVLAEPECGRDLHKYGWSCIRKTSPSEAILALKSATFPYKQELDPEGVPRFGLVAGESDTICIGTFLHTATYSAGISGQTAVGGEAV